MSDWMRSRRRYVWPLLLVFVVCILTFFAARWPVIAFALASTPARVWQGQVWLLVTSGLLAQHPIGASLISFGLLASLTFLTCGHRAFWISALLGHVGSTVATYCVIVSVRAIDGRALDAAFRSHDYGVSAVSAAWLGAIALVGWRSRRQSTAGRAAIVLSCLAVGLFAYTLRPGVTILASEHLLAFAIGIAVAARLARPDAAAIWLLSRLARRSFAVSIVAPPRLRRIDPLVAGVALVTAALVGGSMMPTAVAALTRQLVDSDVAEATCLHALNHPPWGRASPVASAGRRCSG